MQYFLITNTATKKPGVPVHLNALLHETFDPKGADIPMQYDWVCRASAAPDRGAPFSFPDEMWLIVKDPSIKFDCHLAFEGMLVSERFLALLKPDEATNFKIAKVNAVNKKKENVSLHPLYYAKFKHDLKAVDRSKTTFVQAKAGGKLVFTPEKEPSIGLVTKLAFDPAKIDGKDLFVSQDLKVNDTFVSKAFKDKFEQEKMLGLYFIQIKDYSEAETFKVKDIERAYGLSLTEIPIIL